jgi:hypothetical protein
MRRADAIAHEKQGHTYNRHTLTSTEAEIGLWAGAKLEIIEDTANVVCWVTRTEPTAYQFMRAETIRLGSDPTLSRTAGEIYLLWKQNTAKEQYWMASTGKKKGPPPVLPLLSTSPRKMNWHIWAQRYWVTMIKLSSYGRTRMSTPKCALGPTRSSWTR